MRFSLNSSMARARWARGVCSAALAAALAACGGGSDDDSGNATNPPAESTASYASGTIDGRLDSGIVVNGVRYDLRSASILDDDGGRIGGDDLELGMVVDVQAGTAQNGADGVPQATASRIDVRAAVEGTLSAVDGDQLTVLGQTVLVDSRTFFEDGRAASLQPGRVLEIHGQRDAGGHILASRIEIEDDADDPFRLRGPVAGLNTALATFRIGGAVVHYGGVAPAPQLADGEIVGVRLARQPNAGGQWVALAVQTRGDASSVPSGAGVQADVEGYVTRMDSGTRFVVGGVTVDASGVRNLPPLQVGSLVEVEGVLQGGVLVAHEVELEDRLDAGDGFQIEGRITALDTAAQTFDVRGLRVDYSRSRFEDGTAARLAVGMVVEVEGMLSVDGSTLVASVVEFD